MPSIRFYKLRGRMLFRPLFLLLAFMLWFEGCTLPKEPGSLWWDIDLIVPMGERTYGIWDLADPDSVLRTNSSGIGMDADSNAYFSLWTETSVAIEDCLYFQPLEFEITRPIDAIQVPIDLDTTFQYTLGSLNPEIAALHDATLEIEPHLLEAAQTFTANELIVSAQTDTGTARLVLINGLPYAVENLEIIFGTAFLSAIITEIGSIAAGEQIVLNCDLREAHLSTTCLFKVRGTGTGGASVSIDSTDHITLAVQIDTVTSDLYEGRFPEQLLYGDTAIAIENQHLIEFATIRSGSMRIELSNQTQVDDTLLVVLPNLVNQLDDSVVVSRFVPAGAVDSSTLDLEGYRVRLTGTEPQLFEGRIIIHSQQTVDDREFDAGSEYASARVTLSRLRFDFFRGTLRDMMLPVPLTGIPVERPPNGWETVHPTQADAYVHFAETFGGEGYVNLNLQTLYNGDQIGESEIVTPGMPLETDTFAVVPGLTGLLDEYPDSAAIQGTLTLNGYISTMDNSVIELGVEIQSPLMITLDDFHPPGTIELIDTGDLRDIQNGTAEVTIRNRLPVGGQVFLIAARDSLDLLVNSGADVDTIIIVAIPEPEVTDGRAASIALTESTVQLSDSLINMFQNPPFYARTDIQIPGTDGDTLTVHGSDYVSVRILARLVYQIHTGEDY